jgi:predicted Zn-dependent protease
MNRPIRGAAGALAAVAAVLALGTAFVLVPGCATNPVTGHSQFSLVSSQQELSIGREGYPAVISEYGAYDENRLAAYVDSVGQRVAHVSHMPTLEWHFTLLDDATVNAFAMPGGYIYITRGILAHLNSEAQLAGVLGHEIGHVTARHTASQITKQQLAGLGLGLASAFSGTIQRYSGAAQQALGLLFLKYSRDNETQADELGVEYATKAGYDPHEIPSTYVMLRRVGEQAGQRMPAFMSTHPDPGDREVRTAELANAAAAGKTGLIVRSRDFVRRTDHIVFGQDPRQGYFEGTRFVQPEMAFEITFPAGWATQNTKSAVAAGTKDQTAAMQLTLADAQGQSDPVLYVQSLARAGKIASFDGRRETIGGVPAWIGHVIVTQQSGQQATLAAAFLADGTRMYQVLGTSTADDTPILAAIRTFRKLDPSTLANVRPARVQVLTVPKTEAFSALVAASGPQAIDVTAESILNNVEPDETVAQGTLVKIVPKSAR